MPTSKQREAQNDNRNHNEQRANLADMTDSRRGQTYRSNINECKPGGRLPLFTLTGKAVEEVELTLIVNTNVRVVCDAGAKRAGQGSQTHSDDGATGGTLLAG
jgi:hypothetical protein